MLTRIPLADVTFVVVDLETTGGSPAASRITEIGAVKVRGGELLGEFATLVDPGLAIPRSITRLTGITDALVAEHPPVEAVLPAFLEFCHSATLVAHNARFDLGFLNANLTRLDYPRFAAPSVCTAALARRLVREEVRNLQLATLAAFFRCRTEPVHRALPDARATVEVFHGLLERAGSFGVLTLEDLVDFARVRNAPLYRARRGLAEGLPAAPGVYAFRSASGEVLYVGKATNLRARVRSYFGNDDRRKVVDLLKEAEAVDHTVCPTPLEAAVREVRLIAAHRPRFNARAKHPERGVYLKLTAERFPRLSIVRVPRADGGAYLGPLPSRRVGERVRDALHEIAPLRRCSLRLGATPRYSPCLLAEIGRCASPCDGTVDREGYRPAVETVLSAMTRDPSPAITALESRIATLAAARRYEDAAVARDRLAALVRSVARTRGSTGLVAAGELVASRPLRGGGAEVVLIRDGRFVASAACAPAEREAAARELRARHGIGGAPLHTWEPLPREHAAEADVLLRWLDGPGARVHGCTGVLASPVAGGRALAAHTGRPVASAA